MKKGFTLLEILLVIAAIGILASIVLVAINPNRQLSQTRNAQRRTEVQNVINAVYQRIIDDAASGSTAFRDSIPTTAGEIYREGTTSGTAGCTGTGVNLAGVTPTYVARIPQDPSEATTSLCSGYSISRNATSNRITVTALNAEAIDGVAVTIEVVR